MNISDTLPMPTHGRQQTANTTDDFLTYLNQQSTKKDHDDYYWLHQGQLQHSELAFELQKMNVHGVAINKATSESNAASTEIPTESIRSSSQELPRLYHLKLPLSTTYSNEDLNVQTPSSSVKNTHYIPSMNTRKPIIQSTHQGKINPTSPTHYKLLKQHHLFMNNHEAELTLNTHELSPHEERELLTQLKNYLHKKGLSLKKLIINGVPHA